MHDICSQNLIAADGTSFVCFRFVIAPVEFTSVPFPVKALKILLHDVQSGGESATITAQGEAYDVDSDDGVSLCLCCELPCLWS